MKSAIGHMMHKSKQQLQWITIFLSKKVTNTRKGLVSCKSNLSFLSCDKNRPWKIFVIFGHHTYICADEQKHCAFFMFEFEKY